jgi:3-oxoacyl-[acyl-carrier protein] reductase/2-hydroxycyclohexanecarboxyl-CoA dehydrogenase
MQIEFMIKVYLMGGKKMSIKHGRVAIVTGAGSGIGKGIAKGLAEEGAVVIVADKNLESAKHVVDEIITDGGEATAVEVDVRKKEQCENMVQVALDSYGTVDILVNNAGLLRDALIHKMTEEQWDTVQDVILKGAFLCTQAVIKVMKERRYGRIINISAVGQIGYRGQANYGSAKAGIISLTRTIVAEYTWCGVTANCILPGPIKTPLAINSLQGRWEETVSKMMPCGRVGDPKDIAYMVKVFAAEEADYITAQMIAVDGGFDLIRY